MSEASSAAMPEAARTGWCRAATCGACTVCCKELTVDTDAIRKVQGVRACTASRARAAASITIGRRSVAIGYCQWRCYAWLDDTWRPDRSQIMLRATDDDVPAGYAAGSGVVLDVLGPCEIMLRHEVGRRSRRSSVPGWRRSCRCRPCPGTTGGRVLLNPSLQAPVQDGDGDAMQKRLVEAFLRSALHPKVPIELEEVSPLPVRP